MQRTAVSRRAPGRAAIYKLMGNAMILAVVGGINDALRMGEEQGLTREQAYALRLLRPKRSNQERGKRMVAGDYQPRGASTWRTKTPRSCKLLRITNVCQSSTLSKRSCAMHPRAGSAISISRRSDCASGRMKALRVEQFGPLAELANQPGARRAASRRITCASKSKRRRSIPATPASPWATSRR